MASSFLKTSNLSFLAAKKSKLERLEKRFAVTRFPAGPGQRTFDMKRCMIAFSTV